MCDSIDRVTPTIDPVPDDIPLLRAALAAEQLARREAEARASGAEAMVAHLKLLIAKLKHDRFGASSERGRKLLDQLELQLEELEAAAAEDEAALNPDTEGLPPRRTLRRKPVRGPLPAHLPRERVVIPGPTECPCCKGRLAKLGEDVTETLEVISRQWKVVQTVRERFTCRACESITQPPPRAFHEQARGTLARYAPAVPPHRTRPGWPRAAGDDPGGEVRAAPAAQSAKRDLRPRGDRDRRLDDGGLALP